MIQKVADIPDCKGIAEQYFENFKSQYLNILSSQLPQAKENFNTMFAALISLIEEKKQGSEGKIGFAHRSEQLGGKADPKILREGLNLTCGRYYKLKFNDSFFKYSAAQWRGKNIQLSESEMKNIFDSVSAESGFGAFCFDKVYADLDNGGNKSRYDCLIPEMQLLLQKIAFQINVLRSKQVDLELIIGWFFQHENKCQNRLKELIEIIGGSLDNISDEDEHCAKDLVEIHLTAFRKFVINSISSNPTGRVLKRCSARTKTLLKDLFAHSNAGVENSLAFTYIIADAFGIKYTVDPQVKTQYHNPGKITYGKVIDMLASVMSPEDMENYFENYFKEATISESLLDQYFKEATFDFQNYTKLTKRNAQTFKQQLLNSLSAEDKTSEYIFYRWLTEDKFQLNTIEIIQGIADHLINGGLPETTLRMCDGTKKIFFAKVVWPQLLMQKGYISNT